MSGIGRRGDKSADIDALIQRSNRLKKSIKNVSAALADSAGMNPNMIGVAHVQGSATGATILGRRRRKRGEFTRLGFYIDPMATQITLFIVPDRENAAPNTADQIKAIASANRYIFDDITDDERMAGYMTREIGPLEFLAKYGITRIVSKNGENGLIATVKDPAMSPYTAVPVLYVGVYDSATTQVGGGAVATWTTCDMDGLNCGTTIGSVIPRPHPNTSPALSYIVSQKVTPRGVKPTFRIIVPKNATRVALRLIRMDEIGSGNMIYEKAIRDEWEIAPQDLMPVDPSVMAEPDARAFVGRFSKFLDFDATYNTIRVVCFGDNVDANGNDRVSNPVSMASVLTDGTFVAGQSVDSTNVLLMNDTPFVSMANAPSGLPIDFILKKRGVKAMFHMLIPDVTTKLTARISEVTGSADVPNSTLQDTWDDIVLPEAGATGISANAMDQFRIARKFAPTLDFNQTYRLKRLVAEGDNIGGIGFDKAVFIAAPGVTFTTPDSEGNFNPTGGTLAFVGITGRRFKKNGVFVKMRITIPRGTQRVTVKIQNLADQNASDAKAKVIEYSFEDIDDVERSAGEIQREFGEKLEAAIPATDTTPVIPAVYGVVRLAAFGDNVNASGSGGKNPDVFRVPVANPTYPIPTPSYLATFSTTKALGLLGSDGTTYAIVPATPILSDLSNLIENDAPAVSMLVWASQFKNSAPTGLFAGLGTGPGGTVTFNDVGADMAFAVVNKSGIASNLDKTVVMATINDLNANSISIEIPGLVEGKGYYVPRVGLMGNGETAKTRAANPLTDIAFRAGFSIDVTLLTGVGITVVDAIDARNNTVFFGYTVPAGQNVLARNIVLNKDTVKPNGTITGYREVGRIVIKDTKSFGTASTTQSFSLPETHPASTPMGNTFLRYQLIVNPIQGGAGPVTTVFPAAGTGVGPGNNYILAGQDAGMFMDAARPAYVQATPRMIVKWKPSFLRVKCNLPDANMLTFVTAKLVIVVRAPRFFNTLNGYLWNPNTGNFTPAITQPTDNATYLGSEFYIDVGQGVGENFDTDRPAITGPIGSATFDPASAPNGGIGGLPSTIANDLLASYNENRNPFIRISALFQNRFDTTTIFNSITTVTYFDLFFPFTAILGQDGTVS